MAIESSCDETAAAVIDDAPHVHSSVVASQTALHGRFGGVVPEIASRAHVRQIVPVIDEALREAGVTLGDLHAVAAVTEPGHVGALLVGLTAGKTLAMALDVPFVAVNHLEAHLYSCRLTAGRDVFPAVGLVVSGGHSNLYDCRSGVEFELLGSTVDDAAGEAFDKVAAMLGLSYPGGPAIEEAARDGNPTRYDFPRAFLKDDRLEFSFSGLKTSVMYQAAGRQVAKLDSTTLSQQTIADVAASFQEAVVDALIAKCRLALRKFNYRTLCVGGGVAANTRLRQRLNELAAEMGVEVIVPPLDLCTDNAAMGAIAWESLKRDRTTPLDAGVNPGVVRSRKR